MLKQACSAFSPRTDLDEMLLESQFLKHQSCPLFSKNIFIIHLVELFGICLRMFGVYLFGNRALHVATFSS